MKCCATAVYALIVNGMSLQQPPLEPAFKKAQNIVQFVLQGHTVWSVGKELQVYMYPKIC